MAKGNGWVWMGVDGRGYHIWHDLSAARCKLIPIAMLHDIDHVMAYRAVWYDGMCMCHVCGGKPKSEWSMGAQAIGK